MVSGWKYLCFRKNAIAISAKQSEGKTLFWQFLNFLQLTLWKPVFPCFSVQILNWPWESELVLFPAWGKSTEFHPLKQCLHALNSGSLYLAAVFPPHFIYTKQAADEDWTMFILLPPSLCTDTHSCCWELLHLNGDEGRLISPHLSKCIAATETGKEGKVPTWTQRDQDRKRYLLKDAEMQWVDVNKDKGKLGKCQPRQKTAAEERRGQTVRWSGKKLCSNVGGNAAIFRPKSGIRQRGEDSRTSRTSPCTFLLMASFYTESVGKSSKVHF